jgi:hypothetical protein
MRETEPELDHARTARDSATGKRTRGPLLEKMLREKLSPEPQSSRARYPRENNFRRYAHVDAAARSAPRESRGAVPSPGTWMAPSFHNSSASADVDDSCIAANQSQRFARWATESSAFTFAI